MTARPELTYREGVPTRDDRNAVHRLLRDIFDVDVAPIAAFGFSDPTYRAFSWFDAAGNCVANAATFTLPLIVGGRRVLAMGIQSVATRPEWRRRGLSHHLLQRALQWCDAQARLTLLMTSIPRLYEPLGFRIVPQFVHVGSVPPAAPGVAGCRRLDLQRDDDRDMLGRLLRHRVPVSKQFAVVGAPGSFVLSLFESTELAAWYIEASHAIVVTTERSDGTLCIVDIVASRIPSLAELLAALGAHPERVEVHFPPDRLAWNATPAPVQQATVLMARGEIGLVHPFMLPETASF